MLPISLTFHAAPKAPCPISSSFLYLSLKPESKVMLQKYVYHLILVILYVYLCLCTHTYTKKTLEERMHFVEQQHENLIPETLAIDLLPYIAEFSGPTHYTVRL